ncbi:GFA family protein [uncultured Tateyamaria sp.]|uniref:GFA family protein n=1 Tax=uncultured Tateyamaria sp. TaxID=455651 RepID=UPI0026279FEF|nr:GFA family protein [uncultured Tateyamaria sp.]
MARTGSCICGAVSYTVTSDIDKTGACHCSMCRKWSGGVYFGVKVPSDGMEITGKDRLGIYASSPWAERAFCATCGSSMYYRVTAEGPMQGEYHIGLGTLDDVSGIDFDGELFIDLKPDAYEFAGEGRTQLTDAQVMAMFSGEG